MRTPAPVTGTACYAELEGAPASSCGRTSPWADSQAQRVGPRNARLPDAEATRPLRADHPGVVKSMGDVGAHPFCGCATTLKRRNRLGRQWVGIDLWDGALNDRPRGGWRTTASCWSDIPTIHYETAPPERTDDRRGGGPLPTGHRALRGAGHRSAHEPRRRCTTTCWRHGRRCQGCDRTFDDPRYLELDHNTPRSDGGLNHITNRVLLCGPCNRAKSNTYTLSGLRSERLDGTPRESERLEELGALAPGNVSAGCLSAVDDLVGAMVP